MEDIDDPSATFVFTTLAGTDDYDALNPDFEMSSAGILHFTQIFMVREDRIQNFSPLLLIF